MDSEFDIATAELKRTIGRHVQELRQERGYDNNVQFALMSKISRPHLDHIEDGKANMTLKTLVQLASALGVEPYQLLMPFIDDDGKDADR